MLSFSNNDNVTLVKTLEDGSIVFLEKGSEITFLPSSEKSGRSI
jgi:hypothetical protein